MNILDEIFQQKRIEVAERRRLKPLTQVRAEAEKVPLALDFVSALRSRPSPALIAEIKHASPSRGAFAPDFDPLHLARIYQENGAAAISVLTDQKYFQGSLESLRQIAQMKPANRVRLPLLCKDFLCDPYQVYEARAAGADAVLLIVASLDTTLLEELYTLALELGMTPMVEVHNRDDLLQALDCSPILIGINNRDLRDFSVRLETTLELRASIPASVCLVSESGIHTAEDVARLAKGGVNAILVGEALVTAADIAHKVRVLSQEQTHEVHP